MFQAASKLKLRYESSKGLISTEDLWDLPLTSLHDTSLDDIAKSIYIKLRESETESFTVNTTKGDAILQLKMDIIKHIIKARLEILDAAKVAAIAKQKKQQILSIIVDKESEVLKGASLDDLRKMLDEL